MIFYSVLLRFTCILLPLLCRTVYLPILVRTVGDPKDKFVFNALIMNNKVLSYLYVAFTISPTLI